ncbi:hypothetical protein SI65_07860 [Aspergillus cristatus]|uniref:CCHC-type domain-containing protein n=1 Tax=Aspergillus cristatus TaxID=573508 RepID=A0A1E3B7E2_ASPCR|nr:hypothetical protein SI65_07860 [Aspergillus cristatus]
MANLLLAKRGESPIQTVGEKWVYNFINRQPELKTRFSRRYDYQRAKCEDLKVINQWFDCVQQTIIQYGILSEDIYNFDETGFAMGLTSTQKVVTQSEYYGRRSVLQPGNREWVTTIESINASGWVLPPCIIFKGKNLIQGWFDDLPGDWRFEVSQNGWTTDEIGLRWLQKHFIPVTTSRTLGTYRLLVLDGHGSHLTPQFNQVCAENSIIPICMPPHSSHLLQPLNIGCFAVLKRTYGQLVEDQMRARINHIDKFDFLAAYPNARVEAFKPQNIQNSFAAAGLAPYNPQQVLDKLNIQLETSTPPGSRPGSRSSQTSHFTPKTPQNFIQLQQQASSIKAFLKRRSKSPPSPTNQALNQLVKGCEIAMNSAIFLAHENGQLRAANEKQKQKRTRSNRRIPNEGGMTVQECQEAIQPPVEAVEPPRSPLTRPPTRPILPPPPVRRKLPKCSKCGQEGHRSDHCPQR